MAVAERTYSFRASDSLAERMRETRQLLGDLALHANADLTDRVARELARAVARNVDAFSEENQSAFMRQTIELLVSAVEKVADDLRFSEAYAELAETRTADEAEFARAAGEAVATRWRAG